MNPMRVLRILFVFTFRIRKWFLLFKLSRMRHVGPYIAECVRRVPDEIYFRYGWRTFIQEADEEMGLVSIVTVGGKQYVTELKYAWDVPMGSDVVIFMDNKNIKGTYSGIKESPTGPIYLTRCDKRWFETSVVHFIHQSI